MINVTKRIDLLIFKIEKETFICNKIAFGPEKFIQVRLIATVVTIVAVIVSITIKRKG